MDLTVEEQEIYDGEHGETLAKVMRTVVSYGDLFGAKRFVPLDKPVHLVTSFGVTMLKPLYAMMEELIESGLKAKMPFTVDPRPLDNNLGDNLIERLVFKLVYGKQQQYEQQLMAVGLKDSRAFTCACYMEEVGNVPEKGDILAWAESSAVVYANSVIGARSNRTSAIIDLFCGILGKTPEFGFLTDEGRKADWIIDVKTSSLPPAQVLGSSIGIKVQDEVPYIRGLDKLLMGMSKDQINDYLKDMGAAAASNGAVALFHVKGITPEAKEHGKKLFKKNMSEYVIDDTEIENTKAAYPVLWKKKNGSPDLCFIGCPHLSLRQLEEWTDTLHNSLKQKGMNRLKIKTVLTAAPDVIAKFKQNKEMYARLQTTGAYLSTTCALMVMTNPLYKKKKVITNSNKLRTYSTARYYNDNEILNLLTE
jgi:predicted aconitase